MKIFNGVIEIKGTLFMMFSLFSISFLGYILGRIKIKGISFATAGVFITSLIYGGIFNKYVSSNVTQQSNGQTIDVSTTVLKLIENIGLIIFIGSIGFISGPDFFKNIKKNIKSSLILGVVINITAGIVCSICYFIGRGSQENRKEFGSILVGVLSGSLTSTPAFSAAKATADPKYESAVTIGYVVAYFFGIIGPVLFVQLAPRIMCVDLELEKELILGEDAATVIPVTNNLQKNNENKEGYKEVVLISQGEELNSERKNTLHLKENEEKEVKKIEITPGINIEEGENKNNEELNEKKENQEIKKDNEPINSEKEDDKNKENMENIENNESNKKLNCIKNIQETDNKKEEQEQLFIIDRFGFCIFSLAALVGIFVGAIKIPLSNKGLDGMTFSLTYTGGILFASLFLGHLGKISKLSLKVDKKYMEMTKELGLFIFYVGVGVPAGGKFIKYFNYVYFFYGIFITIIPCLTALIFGKYVFKINLLRILGTITGGITSTPSLFSLMSMCQVNKVIEFYASTYPIALILVVFLSEVLTLLLG